MSIEPCAEVMRRYLTEVVALGKIELLDELAAEDMIDHTAMAAGWGPGSGGPGRYSRQELVAEMTAAFLCGSAGSDSEPSIENSAAHVASWIRVLKGSPKRSVIAVAHAQKAVDWILGECRAGSSAEETADQAAA
jgi:hypothetical protein